MNGVQRKNCSGQASATHKKLSQKDEIYYVYILLCKGNSYYTGITNDLLRRLKKHKNGRGAKYTKLNEAYKYICAWIAENKSLALSLERVIKTAIKKQKIIFTEDTNALKTFYRQKKGLSIKIRRVSKKTIDKINSSLPEGVQVL